MRRREPKKQFRNWTFESQLNQIPFHGMPLKVEAFACACGGKFVWEIENFLCSVRAYYKNRIYIITDEDGKKEIDRVSEKYEFTNIIILKVIDDDYINNVERKTKNVIAHDKYWSAVWIYAKLDVFRMAIIEENKTNVNNGVLLLDSDIILNSRIDEEWDADLVMSCHGLSTPRKPNYSSFGFWNAGFVLSNKKGVAIQWIRNFLQAGPNSFYEQKCMEKLCEKWVTEIFPEQHNFGKWRRENLERSLRPVKSFHLHIGENIIYPEQPEFHKQAEESLQGNKKTCKLIQKGLNKFAFIHVPRTAGTYVRQYFQYKGVADKACLQMLDSWILKLEREWTDDELCLIAEGKLWGQKGDRFFVHNHVWGYTERSIRKLKKNGFITFSFLRDIRDVLCSCWYYYLKHKDEFNVIWHNEKEYSAKKLSEAKDINEGLMAFLTDLDLIHYWRLPKWFNELNIIIPWSDDNFSWFLKNYFNFDYVPTEKSHTSSNPGWNYLVKENMISNEVIEEISDHKHIKNWDRVYRNSKNEFDSSDNQVEVSNLILS